MLSTKKISHIIQLGFKNLIVLYKQGIQLPHMQMVLYEQAEAKLCQAQFKFKQSWQ